MKRRGGYVTALAFRFVRTKTLLYSLIVCALLLRLAWRRKQGRLASRALRVQNEARHKTESVATSIISISSSSSTRTYNADDDNSPYFFIVRSAVCIDRVSAVLPRRESAWMMTSGATSACFFFRTPCLSLCIWAVSLLYCRK